MISKSNVKFTGDVAWMVKSLIQQNEFSLKQCIIKQLLDSVFVTSRKMKVSASVIYQPQSKPSASADNNDLNLA